VEMLGLPALPFAVGMYLPLGLSTPIMIGGLIAWWVQRKRKTKMEHDPGVLTASGLVAGQGLIGVALAGVTALITWWWNDPRWMNPLTIKEEPVSPLHLGPWIMEKFDFIPLRWGLSEAWWNALPMLPFIPLALWLWWCARKRPAITLPPDADAVTAPPSPRPTPKPVPLEPSPELAPPPVEPPPAPAPAPSGVAESPPARKKDDASRWAPPASQEEPKADAYAPPPDIGAGAPGEAEETPPAPEDESARRDEDAPVDSDKVEPSTPPADNIDEAIKRARERLDGIRQSQDSSKQEWPPRSAPSNRDESTDDSTDSRKPSES